MLGLNWDSFKWRNYDYTIGRFMSIDPLAEKYSYQSPYNFSENRVIDSRELEGLEAVKVNDLENNQINVTIRVKPVNNTIGKYSEISNAQMQSAFNNFKSQAQKSWSGKNTAGQQVNVEIINYSEATLTMEFVPFVGDGSFTDGSAFGLVADKDFGNTQTGNMQISTGVTRPDDCDCGHGATANHELGHILGFVGHIEDAVNKDYLSPNKEKAEKQKSNNLMRTTPQVSAPGTEVEKNREILPSQRDTMLDNIPEQ